MIKIEHVTLPSPAQMDFVIEGMRNPMSSWSKGDSFIVVPDEGLDVSGKKIDNLDTFDEEFWLGDNDDKLMRTLAAAGTDHRKYMRQMPVFVRVTAPLYWYKEMDTYKVGTISNSCSTMHKIAAKEFDLDDFSLEHLTDFNKNLMKQTINQLNMMRTWYLNYDSMSDEEKASLDPAITCKKDIWWQMIQLLPSSYNQTRNISLNYEVLMNIYHSRKNHKLDEWRDFCAWIETIPFAWLIVGDENVRAEGGSNNG